MLRSMIVSVVASLCLLAPLVAAQVPAAPEKTGLKIGEKSPAVKLKDQSSGERTIENIRKDADYVAIVFYRSASW